MAADESIERNSAARFGRRLARLRVALALIVASGVAGVFATYTFLGGSAALLAFLAFSGVAMILVLIYHYAPCPGCGEQFFIRGRPGTPSWAVDAKRPMSLSRSQCINCGFSISRPEGLGR